MFKNWQTTLGGIAGFLAAWLPVFQDWLAKNPGHVGPLQWFGLAVLSLGLVSKDHNKTGT